jgi:hypothetical protein
VNYNNSCSPLAATSYISGIAIAPEITRCGNVTGGYNGTINIGIPL